MREILNVRGTQTEIPASIDVDVDTVYIRDGIIRIDEEGFAGWQYSEKQYKKDEYIEMLAKNEQINELEAAYMYDSMLKEFAIEETKTQQADLMFQLMMKGVL